jgi:hypothetical protein
MNIMDATAVLYSFEQGCFHLETMREYIESNLKATMDKKDHQYRLIAIAENWKEGDKICDQFSKLKHFRKEENQ